MNQFIYQELSLLRRFGVEIEVSNNLTKWRIAEIINEYESASEFPKRVVATSGVEGHAVTRNNCYWHVKFDRSCGPKGREHDHGWEIASYIANGPQDIKHISKAATFLAANGAETNSNCGLHVHVETIDFDQRQMSILLGRWLKVEKILFDICNSNRKSSVYCKSLFDHYLNIAEQNKIVYHSDQPHSLWSQFKPKSVAPSGPHRWMSLNLTGFASAMQNPSETRNTVELRMPECVLNEEHISNWTALIVNFVEVSSKSSPPADILASRTLKELLFYLGLSGIDEFMICEPDLIRLKIWLLKKISNSECHLANEASRHLELFGQK